MISLLLHSGSLLFRGGLDPESGTLLQFDIFVWIWSVFGMPILSQALQDVVCMFVNCCQSLFWCLLKHEAKEME